MEKYKVCPVCGHHNHPLYLECIECEADLQTAPVVDRETDMNNSGEQNVDKTPAPVMVRLCDCGTKNPVQARRCTVCGEDISMIIPTADTVEDTTSNSPSYVLSSLDGCFAFEIPEGVTVIGREHEMQQYLSTKSYVSRKHAELMLDTDAAVLKIKNCNATNDTFVNNQRLSGTMEIDLKDGDEIGLGGNERNGVRQEEAAYFLVRIGSCI